MLTILSIIHGHYLLEEEEEENGTITSGGVEELRLFKEKSEEEWLLHGVIAMRN